MFKEVKRFYKSIKRKFKWNIWFLFKHNIYRFLLKKLQWWPIEFIKKTPYRKPKKRIAYYLWEYPSLSQTFVQREINALADSGCEVVVFSDITSENFIYGDDRIKPVSTWPLNRKKLKIFRRKFFFKYPFRLINLYLYTMLHNFHPYKNFKFDRDTFNTAIFIAGLAQEKKIDHIHSPWADRCAFISLLASKILNIPYSLQARAHDIHRKEYLYGLKEKFENADFVVTNTVYNYNYIKSDIIPSIDGKLNLIYNGVNLSRFIPTEKKEDNGIVSLISVGRIIEQKGFEFLLEACRILKEKGYNFSCRIIGGPEVIYMNYYLRIKKLHKEYGLMDNVFFLKSLPFSEVLKCYQDSDIFILPCVIADDGSRDITPNAVIEAMAMKLPVVSTTVTGVPEIVDHEKNGILVQPNNSLALSEAVERLINDKSLRKKFGENGRKKVEERFDINKNINNYINLFHKTG